MPPPVRARHDLRWVPNFLRPRRCARAKGRSHVRSSTSATPGSRLSRSTNPRGDLGGGYTQNPTGGERIDRDLDADLGAVMTYPTRPGVEPARHRLRHHSAGGQPGNVEWIVEADDHGQVPGRQPGMHARRESTEVIGGEARHGAIEGRPRLGFDGPCAAHSSSVGGPPVRPTSERCRRRE